MRRVTLECEVETALLRVTRPQKQKYNHLRRDPHHTSHHGIASKKKFARQLTGDGPGSRLVSMILKMKFNFIFN